MKQFAELWLQLTAEAPDVRHKALIQNYFSVINDAEAAWAVQLLLGRRLPKTVPAETLWSLCASKTGLPEWLLDRCRTEAKDTAEAVALLVGSTAPELDLPLPEILDSVLALRGSSQELTTQRLSETWQWCSIDECLLLNKLYLGSWRPPVPRRIVIEALASLWSLHPLILEERIEAEWSPTEVSFRSLQSSDSEYTPLLPIPFAKQRRHRSEDGAEPDDWLSLDDKLIAHPHGQGIRAQLLRRADDSVLWSEEFGKFSDRFPEIMLPASWLPEGTILEGEIVTWQSGPLGRASLQPRLSGKLTARLLQEYPAAFVACDLVKLRYEDRRQDALTIRHDALRKEVAIVDHPALRFVDPLLHSSDEVQNYHAHLREKNASSLLLRHASGSYDDPTAALVWPTARHTLMLILTSVQSDEDVGALLCGFSARTDSPEEVQSIVRTSEGITQDMSLIIREYAREYTVQQFGPMRALEPALIFEVSFVEVIASARHKSGFVLTEAEVECVRQESGVADAAKLSEILELVR